MSDPFEPRRRRWRSGFLELDAFVDDALYRAGAAFSRGYESYTVFMDRFGVSGFARLVLEIVSDGVSLAVLGGIVMLAFAKPAFDYTKTDWRAAQDYAVVFLDRAGNEIGRRGILHQETVKLEDIPQYLIQATIATEDRRFYEHYGIDVFGTLRALITNARASGVRQGGSSLTQQLAKNLFLSNERTLERKIREAFLALWLEANMSKDEILKTYLDRAYMGGGAFGVEAAARFYFGKSVRDVTLAEAAMLAGLYKAPTKYAPHINLPAARARANQVLTNMVEAGYMTEGQVWGARRNPATPIARRENESPDYFLDWAFEEVKRLVPKGDKTLTVKTTIDMNLQKKAEQAIETSLRKYEDQYDVEQGALVCLDLDGSVRAMVGGRDYGDSQFNRAVVGQRQVGSSFKPYVYLTAFMNGYTPRSVVNDTPITIGNWTPHNDDNRYAGPVMLTDALARSINTVAVRLGQQLGISKVIETARKAGITSDLPHTPSLPLGVADLTVLEQAQGYAHFANGGKSVEAHGVIEIRNSRGDVVWRRDRDGPPVTQVFPTQAVANLNGVLNQVVERGTGTRAQLDDIPVAGKTGTTNSFKDAWFIGFTGNYVTAVWFGNDDSTPTNRMFGGTVPAMTWHDFMVYAQQGVERKPIPGIPDVPLTRVSRATRTNEGQDDGPILTNLPVALSSRAAKVLLGIEEHLRQVRPLSGAPERVSALPPQPVP